MEQKYGKNISKWNQVIDIDKKNTILINKRQEFSVFSARFFQSILILSLCLYPVATALHIFDAIMASGNSRCIQRCHFLFVCVYACVCFLHLSCAYLIYVWNKLPLNNAIFVHSIKIRLLFKVLVRYKKLKPITPLKKIFSLP